MRTQTQWLFEAPPNLGVYPFPSPYAPPSIWETESEWFVGELETGTIRRDRNYIQWVQRSLNQIIKAGLATDGLMGRNTRRAIATFQKWAGLTGDGIVGANTEKALIAAGASPPPRVSSFSKGGTPVSNDDRSFKKHKLGYSRYGGGRLSDRLRQLQTTTRLAISDADIDMFQRIANVETGGNVQAINSWDNAFMSMGFKQWTVRYNKLQKLIQRVPHAFKKYGIELDPSRQYRVATNSAPLQFIAIKGAPNPNDLRSLEWAKRFYAAGLDTDVLIAQVHYALEESEDLKKKLIKKAGNFFLPHYQTSPILRALIQATYNNRPAYMSTALANATAKARQMENITTDQFLELVRQEIKVRYEANEGEDGLKKANNLIYKTARLVL